MVCYHIIIAAKIDVEKSCRNTANRLGALVNYSLVYRHDVLSERLLW